MSTNQLGKVRQLFITISSNEPREIKEQILVEDGGVVGDKFYAKDMNRLILIASLDAYELATQSKIEMEYGALGENILIEGSINSMRPGDQFRIGDVTLEITQNCTLCNGLSKINSKLPKLLKDDRGIFAKAIGSGVIKKGDIICL